MSHGSGVKTNERPGTRAQVRFQRVSAYKAREVLDLIRDLHVRDADQVLAFTDRDVAKVVRKVLASAVANARNNDSHDPDTLKVVACYADEGPTLKRWRPRARGRATRIRKRTCHITVIVGRMEEGQLRRWQEQNQKGLATEAGRGGRRRSVGAGDRRARVAKSRAAQGGEAEATDTPTDDTSPDDAEVTEAEAAVDEAVGAAEEPSEAGAATEDEPEASDGGDADAADTDDKDS